MYSIITGDQPIIDLSLSSIQEKLNLVYLHIAASGTLKVYAGKQSNYTC